MLPRFQALHLRRVLGLWLLVAVASSAVAAVRQTSGVLCQGSRWETPYYLQQSDEAGPTVIITGGIHGDETAGAAAAEQIRRWPIARGTLAVLPRANPPGLAAHTRLMPDVESAQGNLNRNFPKAGQPGPAEGEPASAIWAWVQSLHPDWLIDLHEGGGTRAAGSKSVGSSAIVFPSPEADAAGRLMLAAVNATIPEEDKRFVFLSKPVDGSLARAAGEHLGARAMILETSIHDVPAPTVSDKSKSASKNSPQKKSTSQSKQTSPAKIATKETAPQKSTAQSKASSAASAKKAEATIKDQPLSVRMRQHRLMVATLLRHVGMIEPALEIDDVAPSHQKADKVWVALYDAGGVGGKGPSAVTQILGAAGMEVVRVGPEEVACEDLDHFDLVIFPGGRGSKEAAAIGEKGRQRVQRFVEQGGGYIGICAGAYLCTSGYDWSLKILRAKTISPHWQRGTGTVQMELTPAGREILGDRPGLLEVHYANGPIIQPHDIAGLPDYEPLAYFRSELAKFDAPKGIMVNAPAIAAGRCGKGRVVLISPHPEQTPGLEDFIRRAALWAVGRE